jgi:hypothetical protein
MTLAYPEETRIRAPERAAPPPAPPRLRRPVSVIPVPPPKRRSRVPARVAACTATAVAALGLAAAQPWSALPRDPGELHAAFVNVGVPRPYRLLMEAPRPVAALAPVPLMGQGEFAPEAAPAESAPPAPPAAPALAEAPPAPVAAPEPAAPASPPKPVLYAARAVTPIAAPAPEPVAPVATAKPETGLASYRVQIAATATDAEAQDAWRDVRRAFPDESRERSLAITPARVNGRDVRRAIITGFPSADAARAYCAQLSAAGRGCLLRGRG